MCALIAECDARSSREACNAYSAIQFWLGLQPVLAPDSPSSLLLHRTDGDSAYAAQGMSCPS